MISAVSSWRSGGGKNVMPSMPGMSRSQTMTSGWPPSSRSSSALAVDRLQQRARAEVAEDLQHRAPLELVILHDQDRAVGQRHARSSEMLRAALRSASINNPSDRPRCTASAREATPSFAYSARVWVLMVFARDEQLVGDLAQAAGARERARDLRLAAAEQRRGAELGRAAIGRLGIGENRVQRRGQQPGVSWAPSSCWRAVAIALLPAPVAERRVRAGQLQPHGGHDQRRVAPAAREVQPGAAAGRRLLGVAGERQQLGARRAPAKRGARARSGPSSRAARARRRSAAAPR